MKIDPKIPLSGEPQSDRVNNAAGPGVPVQGQTRTTAGAAAQSEDTFQVSGRHAEVQQLTAQAATVPEVRADKVAPLQAQVQRGNYKPDSQKVADALLAEQSRTTAKG